MMTDDATLQRMSDEARLAQYAHMQRERVRSAGPEMLSALNKIVGLCLDEDQDPDTLSEDVFGIASRAIAKAMGRTA